ncbi:PTS system 2-O-a-mannosyl-D-glycerate specific transporter subunit IIABC [Enterobacter hormaechei]|nr:PTS system 2-O-a-mannosyl-D-glycerate specific transporter subunit IIABC [Enterobacter hormaechei]
MAAVGWFGAALAGAAISTLILLLWRRQAVKSGTYVTEDIPS